ncbi:MlaD family protein [Trichlorobacter ammonificans]|uniref:Phospholipid/cholesterol/gamma-HCH transport system substrate-binding protein n=1 Tax=Trichlorobacter ammonificans TaxID=2916410 RepID=A0ABN8HKS2_9BACT|nr:MlaD family protein [Trichlorobacter ammonificans]CAH2031641.1 Phospholipid/cholesterol/gamma-HCH transport system substrate-binding protein [Trichlorobacter ammonificans]
MSMEQDPRFKYLERKIGLFVLAALAGVVLVVALVGYQKDLFTSTYTLHFTVDRGTGFTKGMPVKLSGFRIGRVTDLALNNQAMVDITIEVAKKYHSWVRSDSTVKLVKEGLVGDSIVEVSVGSLDKPQVKDGDSLTYVKTKGLDELADEIAEKVKPVLIEVKEIISYVNDPEGDLKKTVRNLELLTRNLETTRSNADALLSGANRNLEGIARQTATLLDTTGRKIDSLDLTTINASLDRLPPLLDKTDAAMANLVQISDDTRLMTRQTFPLLPGLLSRTEELLFSTDRLMNTLNRSWLLGGTDAPSLDRTGKAGDSHD